jgi:hypothetical protein
MMPIEAARAELTDIRERRARRPLDLAIGGDRRRSGL